MPPGRAWCPNLIHRWKAALGALGAVAAVGAAQQAAEKIEDFQYEQAARFDRENVHRDGTVVSIGPRQEAIIVSADRGTGDELARTEFRSRIVIEFPDGSRIEGSVPTALTTGLKVGRQVEAVFSEHHYPDATEVEITGLIPLGEEI